MEKQQSNYRKLQIFLKVYGVLTLLIFGILAVAFLFKIPDFNPGGRWHWLIWDDVHGHVAPMLIVIYLTWGIFFFLASKDPIRYEPFLTFTMWANLVHGLLMIPMAFDETMYHSKFLTDIPFLLFLSLGLYVWRPAAAKAKTTH